MRHAIAIGIWASLLAVAACGGSDKKVEEPEPVAPEPEDETAGGGDDMIEPEVFEDIRRTFERKQTIVGRCFVEGVEAGEVQPSARGYVTVIASIHPDGKARDVEISEATLTSKTLQQCVIGLVESWAFPAPPREVKQSFTYVMERL